MFRLSFLFFFFFVIASCSVSASDKINSTASERHIYLNYTVEELSSSHKTLIHVDKRQRLLNIYRNGNLVRQDDIQLGFNPSGHKKYQGDGKTPEGLYYIDRKNPESRYYLSLGMSYPNKKDKANANQEGLNPGGDIFIHGQPNELSSKYFISYDWTEGCIAVKNHVMDVLYHNIKIGTPILITE